MAEEKKDNKETKVDAPQGARVGGNRPGDRRGMGKGGPRRRPDSRSERPVEEFEQKIVDIARVTRVMAGGKRMRFRACVALGNKKGRVAIAMAKGADVTLAVQKAVNKAKKEFVDVPLINDTIPHEITEKFKAAKVLLKPAKKGKGVIAGGTARLILELAGVHNIYSKNLGTSNKINIAKCVIKALGNLKKGGKKGEEAGEEARKAVKEVKEAAV